MVLEVADSVAFLILEPVCVFSFVPLFQDKYRSRYHIALPPISTVPNKAKQVGTARSAQYHTPKFKIMVSVG